jgi:hypothetical protein
VLGGGVGVEIALPMSNDIDAKGAYMAFSMVER